MRARLMLVLAATLVAALALAIPAAAQPTDEDEGGGSIRGYITEKKDRTILVEEKPCRIDGRIVKYTRCDVSQWRGDKGYYEINQETRIFDRSGGDTTPASYRDLAVGQTVNAVYRGAVQTSYPGQGLAKRVTILAKAGTPAGG